MKDIAQFGKCHICGKDSKLSYEHIPPQKAFNNQKVKMYKGSDFKKVIESKKFYWEYPKVNLKYTQKQSGAGCVIYECRKLCGNVRFVTPAAIARLFRSSL